MALEMTMGRREQLMVWSERDSLGVDHLDAMHRALCGITNRLWSALVRGADNELDGILAELEQRARLAFAAEEAAMRAGDYRRYDQHLAAHARFLEELAAFRSSAARGEGITLIGLELLEFLRDWVATHVQEADRGYARHVARRQHPVRRIFSALLPGLA